MSDRAVPRPFGAAVRDASRRLAESSDTPRLDAELLVARAAGCGRAAVIAFPERELAPAAVERLDAWVQRRRAGEPLAYLLAEKEFYSLVLEVGADVLVPRPETEHLVDEALGLLPLGPAAVLDLGTGSGALALAIKQARPAARVLGVDASEAALAVARRNAAKLGLDVGWRVSSWYAALDAERYDVIVCNPPYLRADDPHFDTGIRFEPRAALAAGEDGLDALRAVIAGATAHLVPGGALLVEHGRDQQDEVAALAAVSGLELRKRGRDLEGRARYVVLTAPAR